MNNEWSNKNKDFQQLIKKEETFTDGIQCLFELRENLFDQIVKIIETTNPDDFTKIPFPNSKGNTNVTIIWTLYHLFRIEDIVAHELLAHDKQIFFRSNWQQKTGSPIITTGNELQNNEIEEFSKQINIKELYRYITSVYVSSNIIIKNLTFSDMKKKFSQTDKINLTNSLCVSNHPDAFYLIDYWCKKDVAGLLKMPFSRHWIMHVEAMLRISEKLKHKK